MTLRIKPGPTSLYTPRFYAEDMKLVQQIVSDACGRPTEVTVTDWNQNYLSSDDPNDGCIFAAHAALEGSRKRFKRVVISDTRTRSDGKKSPEIEVFFYPFEAFLVLENPSEATRNAASRIEGLCQERSRRSVRRRAFVFPGLFYALMLLAVATSGLHIFLDFALDGSLEGTSWRMLVMLPLGGVLCFLVRGSQYDLGWPKLVNAPRADYLSWWERHRRDATYLVIGLILGAFASYWVNQIPPPPQLQGRD